MLNPKHLIKLLIVVCAFSSMMAFADDSTTMKTSGIESSETFHG
jgi:hypothetical protein